MATESIQTDVFVAAAAAGSTVALALVFEFVVATEPSFYLQAAPLLVYFVYLFAHSKLPDGIDQQRTWIGLTVAVAVGSLAAAVL